MDENIDKLYIYNYVIDLIVTLRERKTIFSLIMIS